MTYSIVARDADSGALGVAVQSHFFGVGRIASWAEAGVGAVATQSFADPSYGPLGLQRMRGGLTASEALEGLIEQDPNPELRQVGMVDAAGRVAAHTGARCVAEARHALGEHAAAQANMMLKSTVSEAMLAAVGAPGRPFPDRLLLALEAADIEGGDIRGKQSAALLVVSGDKSDRPWEHVLCDLRVDDHPEPLQELRRLLDFHAAYETLGGVLFTPGVITGEFTASDEEVTQKATALAQAQTRVGDNPEPTLWRGVLLARAGRPAEAHEDFEYATSKNPALADFLVRLRQAGFIPDEPRLDQSTGGGRHRTLLGRG